MEEGFVEATSHNLPIVDLAMVFDYFKSNKDFEDPELRNVKTTKTTRENYGDNAVGYVQLKRVDNICKIKARITPEHKIHKAAYHVVAHVDEQEHVVQKCECLDCSASAGGCKHSLAFLLWLHRRSEEPSVTSVKCYWKKPKLSKVGTSLKFATLQDLCSKTIPPLVDVGDNFLKNVLEKGKDLGYSGTLFQSMIDSDPVLGICLHRLHSKYKQEGRSNKSVDDFLNYVAECIDNLCATVAKETEKQHKSPKWYRVRYGRITASKLYEAAHCQRFDGALVKNILGACRPIQTDAVERGKQLEAQVRREFGKTYEIKIKDAGFFIDKMYPVCGASPDGLTSTHVIEIKCSTKKETMKNYITDNGISAKPYAQVQLQMFLTKRKYAYFIIAAPDFEQTKHFQVGEVDSDLEYITEILTKAMDFWKTAIYPKL